MPFCLILFFHLNKIVQDVTCWLIFFSVADQLGSRRLVGTIKRQLEGCNTCTCAGSSLPRRSNKFNCKWVKVQVFCPVEQALAGSKDNEFRWCIRNTSKKLDLGYTAGTEVYLYSNLYFLSALCSYKLDLDYFLACRFFCSLYKKEFWMKNRIDSTHTEPCTMSKLRTVSEFYLLLGKSPENSTRSFFFLSRKTKNEESWAAQERSVVRNRATYFSNQTGL